MYYTIVDNFIVMIYYCHVIDLYYLFQRYCIKNCIYNDLLTLFLHYTSVRGNPYKFEIQLLMLQHFVLVYSITNSRSFQSI